ncbi:Anaphase spindle elongation protein 1 [Cyphellophora attinorum]|uniref:Anaphase spindle elongation protein 1 n=1 Tax=Cyphellophora attinorum TaxID=1664694 RepID=A0A0N1GXP2_9EURO|nr:Anaphase spindle elongation protein 1 [Phialophora attinorum]KPI35097.1 Anaphase spindle elongation protein 1 [Phialophora attinorum]
MSAAMDTSYLTTQVNTIIGQLHTIWDEIGIPRNERDSRETELFAALSDTLHNQLRLVNSEKSEMTEEATNIIKTIKQMEASLDDEKDRGYDLGTTGLRVSFPLNECLRDLKEKYNTVARLHRERFEQVKKLIRLPPTNTNTCPPNFDLSPSYVAKLDEEFTRVYDEYNKRVVMVQSMAEEIVRLWSELGIPQAQTDSSIVQHYRESPEQLGLHQADLDRLKSRRDKLTDEKSNREKRLSDMKKAVESLWDRLGIEEADRKAFLAANRGCGLRTINEFEDELARLNELKRQNLHLFVEDARVRLQELWDALFFSEEEMLDFTPAFSDVYSDALLSAHEAEIERLITLKDQRAPILEAIEKHRSLVADKESLEASAADASRLLMKPQKGEKRDPGKLLREEKMRKRIAKELPKVAAALVKTLQKYEDDYGRPFLVHGQSYLDELEEMETRAPPPRSKTPNAMPARPKTPAAQQTRAAQPKSAPSTVVKAQPPRPQSSMRGHQPSKSVSKTPTIGRSGSNRSQVAASVASTAAPSTQQKSPSKIPSRAPLGNLQYGNNSPERRHNAPTQAANFGGTLRAMGPPRVPPPKMRDLQAVPQAPQHEPLQPQYHSNHQPVARPVSTVSNGSNDSGRYVRPMSPEDVYDDRERMSYMSASLVNRDRQLQQQQQQSQYPNAPRPPSRSREQDFHASVSQHPQMMPPPPRPDPTSRQTSNTSSNMTTGTTATSTSENWESYSDVSELESERNAYGMRPNPTATNKQHPAAYTHAHMAPPVAKQRLHNYHQTQTMVYLADENHRPPMGERLASVEGSEGAWSTEAEETY